jgi:hypothetical protein
VASCSESSLKLCRWTVGEGHNLLRLAWNYLHVNSAQDQLDAFAIIEIEI